MLRKISQAIIKNIYLKKKSKTLGRDPVKWLNYNSTQTLSQGKR